MTSEKDHPVTNGYLTLTTERGVNIGPRGTSETHITITKDHRSMFTLILNTPENRKFLRSALKRMDDEAARNARIKKQRGNHERRK